MMLAAKLGTAHQPMILWIAVAISFAGLRDGCVDAHVFDAKSVI